MKKITFMVLFIGNLLVCDQLFAYGKLDYLVRFRFTDKGAAVPIDRKHYTYHDLKMMALDEASFSQIYPQATRLYSAFDYELALHHTRNCHDFAWGPYMECMCNEPGTQKEAWWMIDPSQNWKDGSMVPVLTSVDIIDREEYLFKTADLASLRFRYQDALGKGLPLPVCPVDNLENEIPQHSAILVNREYPIGMGPTFCVGVFISKWGDLGIYRHRWGKGYCPDGYFDTQVLQIFAPRPSWSPPYVPIWPW